MLRVDCRLVENITNSILIISKCHELYLYDSILHELSLYDSTNRWDRFQLHLHYQKSWVDLEKKIWRLMGFADMGWLRLVGSLKS